MLTARILERTTEPLMVPERPYESSSLNFTTVIREGDVWHMWYKCFDQSYVDDGTGFFCYARSIDGMHWERPDLGIVEYNGNRQNNILHDSRNQQGALGHMVFLDLYAPANERFKMLLQRKVEPSPWLQSGRCRYNFAWQVYGAVSGDGINWRMLDEPLFPYNSDTQTTIVREPDRYRMYVRMWGTRQGCRFARMVGYTESNHFGNFLAPTDILRADDVDPDEMDFYTSAATKLRDDLYVMLPAAFYHREDVLRPHLAVSRDGVLFTRVGREPLFDLGAGFDSHCIYVAPGAVPGPRPNTWWFYYLGHHIGHAIHPDKTHANGGYGRFLLELLEDN